jgi:CheY-like chemotaxis protein
MQAASPVPEPAVAAPGKLHVVFAEDDALVAMSTVDMLEALDYQVSAASDEASALELISKVEPAVLLVDVNLGGGDGRKLAQTACQMQPKLKVIFATGRDPGDLHDHVPGALILNKPYGMADLKEALETLFPPA